jgi:putative membrane protein
MKQKRKGLFNFLRSKPFPINTREILALERTKLANERTLLAYIRASLYLLLGGLALLQLRDFQQIHWLGYFALVICVLFLMVGITRFVMLKRRLYKWNAILSAETISEEAKKAAEDIETAKDIGNQI